MREKRGYVDKLSTANVDNFTSLSTGGQQCGKLVHILCGQVYIAAIYVDTVENLSTEIVDNSAVY
jgi:hypothetical protein